MATARELRGAASSLRTHRLARGAADAAVRVLRRHHHLGERGRGRQGGKA